MNNFEDLHARLKVHTSSPSVAIGENGGFQELKTSFEECLLSEAYAEITTPFQGSIEDLRNEINRQFAFEHDYINERFPNE